MSGTLLPYQDEWISDFSPVKFWEKSRRIGASWCDAADSALIAAKRKDAGGMSTYYLSYNKDMTKQYVQDVAEWAQKYNLAASEVEELVLEKEEQDITIYQVRFASGFVVQGLSSNPSNLRSKQGRVRIDEAAFVENLRELLKAAIALTMWGGDVAVISTHDGDDSEFNQYIQDIRAGKLNYSLHRTTLDDALAAGLFRRICEVKGLLWSPEAEAAWKQSLLDDYGDDADEELYCIPKSSSGGFLTRALIENCMDSSISVVRWQPPASDFVDWPLEQAEREVADWCEEYLVPLLHSLPDHVRSYIGGDFGRSGDLSCFWPLLEQASLHLHTPFVLELRNCPFRTQEQILSFVIDRLKNFCGGALDARGNGQALAEYARQRYGASRIAEVMLSETWYRENMPRLKAQFEDRTIDAPMDALILDDLRAFKMIKGVAKIPASRTKDATGQRHGDAGIAAAMAVFAAKTFEASGPVFYEPVSSSRVGSVEGAW
ncbi:MAG: terminase large subunit domain-containing protein [Desulfovibrio sp.]|uniref:terminase large subunit domain-containing protein n=1 Tax=Desulfovibrio sp. 7SRBS1 TaxID=3378064 RepID=UPI003B3E9F83